MSEIVDVGVACFHDLIGQRNARESGYGVVVMSTPNAGPLLREWRVRRRMSQLDLSARTGVSTRHLSCVETGRARPSRELLLFLADELEVPKRNTNEILLAAGFAPVFTEFALSDTEVSQIAGLVRLVLDGNDPNPTTVIDTRWNLVDANHAALWFTQGVAAELLEPPINVARLSLHPDGLAPRVRNFGEYAAHLLRQMHRTLEVTHDPQLAELIEEISGYASGAIRNHSEWNGLVLPLQLSIDGHELSFLSTVTTFGAALDVTLSELSIETLYAADEATSRVLGLRPWR